VKYISNNKPQHQAHQLLLNYIASYKLGEQKRKKTTTNNQAKQGEKNTQQNQTITVKAAKRTFK